MKNPSEVTNKSLLFWTVSIIPVRPLRIGRARCPAPLKIVEKQGKRFSGHGDSIKRSRSNPVFGVPRGIKASALILVLWATVLMMLTVLGLAELVNSNLNEEMSKNKQFRARLLAQSGIALALHPEVMPGDKVLSQNVAESTKENFSVELSSESGRVNINLLLTKMIPPNDPKVPRARFMELLRSWELNAEEATMIADCLVDWIDPDDLHKLNGAEREYYSSLGKPNQPPNRPFRSVEEMASVKGMDLLEKKHPKWREAFTIWGDGKLSVNHSPQDILQYSAGFHQSEAEALLKYRNGADGKSHTKDDLLITNMVDVLRITGLPQSPSSLKELNDTLSLEDKLWRVESTGTVHDYKRKITLIADRTAKPQQFLEWLEK